MTKCYVASCNLCDSDFEHPIEGWSLFNDKDIIYDSMLGAGWYISDDDNDDCYCPKCHKIDNDDNLIVLTT